MTTRRKRDRSERWSDRPCGGTQPTQPNAMRPSVVRAGAARATRTTTLATQRAEAQRWRARWCDDDDAAACDAVVWLRRDERRGGALSTGWMRDFDEITTTRWSGSIGNRVMVTADLRYELLSGRRRYLPIECTLGALIRLYSNICCEDVALTYIDGRKQMVCSLLGGLGGAQLVTEEPSLLRRSPTLQSKMRGEGGSDPWRETPRREEEGGDWFGFLIGGGAYARGDGDGGEEVRRAHRKKDRRLSAASSGGTWRHFRGGGAWRKNSGQQANGERISGGAERRRRGGAAENPTKGVEGGDRRAFKRKKGRRTATMADSDDGESEIGAGGGWTAVRRHQRLQRQRLGEQLADGGQRGGGNAGSEPTATRQVCWCGRQRLGMTAGPAARCTAAARRRRQRRWCDSDGGMAATR
ncbi:hypothetical protein Scep_030670 [Stephania cephalantha]|uniref:Uncharacterized protein n=1 Tax=Stephania cephalantha TaxID=152367 RepID=A0AAP0E026_9MAGN